MGPDLPCVPVFTRLMVRSCRWLKLGSFLYFSDLSETFPMSHTLQTFSLVLLYAERFSRFFLSKDQWDFPETPIVNAANWQIERITKHTRGTRGIEDKQNLRAPFDELGKTDQTR